MTRPGTGSALRPNIVFALLLGLIVLSFAVRGVHALERNTNAAAFDQRSYLGLGLNISESRDMSDGKRHPLLPAILSLVAERDWPYYARAKMLNVGLGALALVVVAMVGRSWFGRSVGLAAAGLLSLNPPFLHVSSHVMAEPLLISLTLLSWYLMVRALTTVRRLAFRYAAAAGALSGLAYLTKGTALQMVPAFVLVTIWLSRRRPWRDARIWVFLVAWMVSWLPLFAFNVQEYGNPLYNYNYKHEIFLDDPADRHFADISEAPTLQTYLQEHTAADMAYRLWFGVREVTRILLGALAPVRQGLLIGLGEWLWAVAWLLTGAALLWRRKELAAASEVIGPAYLLLGAMLVASMIPLGWFVQASNVGPRFVVVFQPMIYILALGSARALALRDAGGGVRHLAALRMVRALAFGMLAIASVLVSAQVWAEVRRDPAEIDRRANKRGQEVLEWLASGTPYGTRVLWGPSYTLPNWIYERRLSLKDVPSKAQDWEAIQEYARDSRLAYAILDWEMVQRRQEAMSPYFVSDYPYVEMRQLPSDWALVMPYDGVPSNWPVFRLYEITPLQREMDVTFGARVQLFGYELYPEQPVAGEVLYVTLYWRALGDLGRDYTVFVHLLDAGGQIVAQSDAWPLGGRYPTSEWRAENAFGDRHTLVVPGTASPGSLLRLAAGIYSAETLERLPAARVDGTRVPEGRVLLPDTLQVQVGGSP